MTRARFHIAPETVSVTLEYFRRYGRFVTPITYSAPLSDEKERIFLEAVLALFDDNAKLVTGNAKHFPDAAFVVSPTDFVATLRDLA